MNNFSFSALVTVVIPTYKRATYLARSIESVIKQTYGNIEIIVVDDNGIGTTDQHETKMVISQYQDRIHYIAHDVNMGGAAARNTGWRVAQGEYITFLDDDDEIAQERIEKQVSCLESLDKSWGACYTAYHVLMGNDKVQHSSTSSDGTVYLQTLMRTLYLGSGSNLLLRKDAVNAVNGYDVSFKRNQDVEFMVRIAEKYKYAYISDDLLTIHYEVRQFKMPFEFVDQIALHYLEKFKSKICALNPKDRKRVTNVISLDRARVAVTYKRYMVALKIIINNRISLIICCRYFFYLLNRIITSKSYGFYY